MWNPLLENVPAIGMVKFPLLSLLVLVVEVPEFVVENVKERLRC